MDMVAELKFYAGDVRSVFHNSRPVILMGEAAKEIERLTAEIEKWREHNAHRENRIDRLTSSIVERESERKTLLDIIDLAWDDVERELYVLKHINTRAQSYDERIVEKQNLMDRMSAALKKLENV